MKMTKMTFNHISESIILFIDIIWQINFLLSWKIVFSLFLNFFSCVTFKMTERYTVYITLLYCIFQKFGMSLSLSLSLSNRCRMNIYRLRWCPRIPCYRGLMNLLNERIQLLTVFQPIAVIVRMLLTAR